MAEIDLTVPVSQLDSAICDAVSKLELAVEREANVTRDEMRSVSRTLWQAMERDRQRRAEQLLGVRPDDGEVSFQVFHNRLRILLSIDRHEAIAAGALAADDVAGWKALQGNPFRFFIHANDGQAAALWNIIGKREGRGA